MLPRLATAPPPDAATSRLILDYMPVTVSELGACSVRVTSTHLALQGATPTTYVARSRLVSRPPTVQTSFLQNARVEVHVDDGILVMTCATSRLASVLCDAVLELHAMRLKPVVASEATSAASAPVVGVAAILKKQEDRMQHESSLASEAFSDLQQLKARAAEVTAVIERCATALKKSGPQDADLAAFDELLTSVGVISNPIAARSGRSAAFVQDLAKEIASFLRSQVAKTSHWTLPDVFAMYNRARGGAGLVSPGDVLRACRALKEVGSEFELVENETNGVKIVRAVKSKFATDAQTYCAKRAPGPVTAVRLCRDLAVPLPVALEWLQAQEAALRLCRDDDHVGNLAFYPNAFMQPGALV